MPSQERPQQRRVERDDVQDDVVVPAETSSAALDSDVDAILDFEHKAPAARQAHPRTEHWAPLYVALGAADASGSLENTSALDGFWFGLSKRSWQFA